MFKKLSLWVAALLLVCVVQAQSLINGTVLDEEGQPLPGANVILQESQQGAVADINGAYAITGVQAGAYTLEVSYVGYTSYQRKILVKKEQVELTENIRLGMQSFQLDELIVHATRASQRTPMTFTNLDKEEIEVNNLGQDVPYVLRWTPSAVVTSDAGTGIGYTGMRIRGTDPTRINVTINGIPLNDAESQGVFWVNLPDFVSSAEDVQIQRGVGSSTNGAGAFGGSINLSTAKVNETPYARVNGTLGSFNTWKGNVQFGTGTLGDGFSLDGRLSKISSDGYVDRATADLQSFYLSGAYKSDNTLLRAHVFSGHERTYQAWWGVSPELLDDPETRTYNQAGTEKSETDPHDNEVDDYGQTHFQLLLSQTLNPLWNLNLALHYTKGGGFYEEYKAQQAFADYGLDPIFLKGDTINTTNLIRRRWLDNDFYGGTYSLTYRDARDQVNFTLGGAYNIYEGSHFGEVLWARFASGSETEDRYYDNDARKTDFNIYGKLNYRLSSQVDAYADLQYRRVGYEFLGFDRNGENVTQEANLNFFNPKIGLTFNPIEGTDIYASLAVANREPNRDDYTESTADSRPKPERLYDTEIGYRRNGQGAGFELNFYYMRYKGQLVLNGQINDVGAYSRINVDDSYRLGMELSGGIDFGSRWHFLGNLTLSRNKVKEFTEYLDVFDADFNWQEQKAVLHENTDLAFSPNLISGAEIRYDLLKLASQELSLSLLGKYVGKQYIDNSLDESNRLDPYFFSDVRLNYSLKTNFAKQISFTLLARNIFDALYETNAWSYRYEYAGEAALLQGFFPQAGRNFLLGMTIDF